jgi:hypothetical protein
MGGYTMAVSSSHAMFEFEMHFLNGDSAKGNALKGNAQNCKRDKNWQQKIGNRGFSDYFKPELVKPDLPNPSGRDIPLAKPKISVLHKENLISNLIGEVITPSAQMPKKCATSIRPFFGLATKSDTRSSQGRDLAEFAFETTSCFEDRMQILRRQHFDLRRQQLDDLAKKREAAQRLTAYIRARMEPRLKLHSEQVVPVMAIPPKIGFKPKFKE